MSAERNSMMKRIRIADGVYFSFLPSDKFKTNFFYRIIMPTSNPLKVEN